MKKQIAATVAAFILINFTACSKNSSIPGSGNQERSHSSAPEESVSNIFSGENSQGGNSADSSSPDHDYDYVMEHRFDNVIKMRGVYGETEIPDIHYENANSEGSVTHSPYGDEWQYYGLESMVFETHTFGEYMVKLVGYNVRTDKENFPDRIFGGFAVEVEKNGVTISKGGISNEITSGAGAMFFPEELIFLDKIGNYLDVYDLEYPVIAMRYYFGDHPARLVHKAVDFCVLKDDECLCGFAGVCEPGCGIAFDKSPAELEAINIVNSEPANCMAALFEADEFKVVDEKTLIDEKAGITYTFDFTEHPVTHLPPFELYTAKKNAV